MNVELSIEDIIRRSKGTDIILSLLEKPKGIVEIQEEVGGSASTVQSRIDELIKDGVITANEAVKFPFKRVISLTQKGEMIARALQNGRNDAIHGKLPNEREKWLLSIIYSMRKVNGITRLEKLLFLLKEQLQSSQGGFYTFVPERFGPYSKEVLDDIYELRRLQILNVTGDVWENDTGDFIIRWNFALTEFGKNTARIAFDDLNEIEKERINTLERYNRMKLRLLLDYVHNKYPNYKKN
jgi:DNA-binding HxlR family transcriptional regulator/uncharacterized protein YwgA